MELHERFESVDGATARWALGLEDAPVDVHTEAK
jgi:hypothetical protein